MIKMRAKLQVASVESQYEGSETLKFFAVCGKEPFDTNGESEDNTYARWTPCANLDITITNPNLLGQFKINDKFYVDFIPTLD